MKKFRIGVIGIGNIGSHHVKYLSAGRVKNAELTAVCDIDSDRLNWVKNNISDKIKCYDNIDAFIASGEIDGIIIAVPHYLHPPYAIKAFEHGLHVISEKPAGVYTRQVREMNEAAVKSGLGFAIMFNQRTIPVNKKVYELIQSGELGEVRRVNYTITSSYRNQTYHNSSSWRSTWEGEGGGALINQYAHNLDLWQKICGMPSRVRGFCYFGKRRDMETEDEVTAYVEYPNGATGVLICSTTEAPGTNMLEIAGDKGKIVVEEQKITFYRTRVTEQEFNKTSKQPFASPEVWVCDVPVTENMIYSEGHIKVTQNWVNSIMFGEELLSPGNEGINSVELINAIYLSSWIDDWVSIPVDEALYYEKLQEKIKNSTYKKPEVVKIIQDNMESTF
jgi:predicted dehydrogenase